MDTITCISVFFFNDTATTEIYTLSLHDALPIYTLPGLIEAPTGPLTLSQGTGTGGGAGSGSTSARALRQRSEEHTSELQSQSNLVCRLLLEKKKIPEI